VLFLQRVILTNRKNAFFSYDYSSYAKLSRAPTNYRNSENVRHFQFGNLGVLFPFLGDYAKAIKNITRKRL
jgi:hypothetical protein